MPHTPCQEAIHAYLLLLHIGVCMICGSADMCTSGECIPWSANTGQDNFWKLILSFRFGIQESNPYYKWFLPTEPSPWPAAMNLSHFIVQLQASETRGSISPVLHVIRFPRSWTSEGLTWVCRTSEWLDNLNLRSLGLSCFSRTSTVVSKELSHMVDAEWILLLEKQIEF